MFSFEEKKAPRKPAHLFVEESGDSSTAQTCTPHQLRGGEAEVFERLASPSERLRYLQETVGLDEQDALRCLSAWVEVSSAKAQPKEPVEAAIAERLVEYEASDDPAYED